MIYLSTKEFENIKSRFPNDVREIEGTSVVFVLGLSVNDLRSDVNEQPTNDQARFAGAIPIEVWANSSGTYHLFVGAQGNMSDFFPYWENGVWYGFVLDSEVQPVELWSDDPDCSEDKIMLRGVGDFADAVAHLCVESFRSGYCEVDIEKEDEARKRENQIEPFDLPKVDS